MGCVYAIGGAGWGQPTHLAQVRFEHACRYGLGHHVLGRDRSGPGVAALLGCVVRIAPAVFVDKIAKVAAPDRTKAAHGIANRENGVGVHTLRQAESGSLLVAQVPRGQRRPQT